MNRSEFAALISSTIAAPQHSSMAGRAQPPTSNPRLPLYHSQPQQPHTLSRRRDHTRVTRSEADAYPQTLVEPRTTRAQQETSSRPQSVRSYSYLPHVKAPQIVTPPAQHGRRTRKSLVAEVEEPDFVREEREAWSKKSPKTEITFDAPRPPSYGRATRASRPNPDIVLQPPRISKEPPPQPRKHSLHTLPLREFAPSLEETNIEERPKTSRGHSSAGNDEQTLRSSEDSQKNAATRQETRRSRFLEGSLSERSAAVASSWCDYDSVSEESYDSDTTPRASKDTCGSGSFESTESKPLPATPATVNRKRLFNFRSGVKSSDDSESTIEHAMPKKRGLRKSLSTWNFHNLGDKMKIFGGSTNDLTPKATKSSKEQQKLPKTPAGSSKNEVLDERKRKAEEVYAQQYGLKKQKSNMGIANITHPSEESVRAKPSSMKTRTPSSSSRTSSGSLRNRVTFSDNSLSFAPHQTSSNVDNSKRPSRKDLEKENQHLRKMLRQSSSMQFDAHRSSVHLPLHEAPSYDNIPRLSQEDFAQGHKMRILPGKKMGRSGEEEVPPVPKLSREVLGSLENTSNSRARVDGKGRLPRPVSMILEEEEAKSDSDLDLERLKMQVSPVKEAWEWPDDVF